MGRSLVACGSLGITDKITLIYVTQGGTQAIGWFDTYRGNRNNNPPYVCRVLHTGCGRVAQRRPHSLTEADLDLGASACQSPATSQLRYSAVAKAYHRHWTCGGEPQICQRSCCRDVRLTESGGSALLQPSLLEGEGNSHSLPSSRGARRWSWRVKTVVKIEVGMGKMIIQKENAGCIYKLCLYICRK
jgi:hypothetical protein